MEMRLNKPILILISLFLMSCKGDAQSSKIETRKEIRKINRGLNFYDKKYSGSLYSLVIDESNISDHPIKSYLNCKDEGYFTIHYIPKTEEGRHYWKDVFLEKYDFENIDGENDSKKIQELLKNKFNEYSIFSYQIKKQFLTSNGGCTEESVYAKKNTTAQIYYYNQNNTWELVKEINSEQLPPYPNSEFFINNFSKYFTIFSVDSNLKNNLVQENKWRGTYGLNLDYGKLDGLSEMTIDYDIEINDNECTLSGIGYKTYFTDVCKIKKNGNELILQYVKTIDGDGFSDHSNIDVLGILIFRNGKYFIKSPIIANEKWAYNVEIGINKK